MIAVIFEVTLDDDKAGRYFDLAGALKPELEQVEGFISVERFQSLVNDGKYVSLSFWRDRAAVEATWQNLGTLIRERLTALPARLASRVANCDDEHQVTLILRVEIETVLNELGADAPGVT